MPRLYQHTETHFDTLDLHSRGEDFRWEVSDVGRDGPPRQELSHLIGEGVAVVLKQTIPVTPETRKKNRRDDAKFTKQLSCIDK